MILKQEKAFGAQSILSRILLFFASSLLTAMLLLSPFAGGAVSSAYADERIDAETTAAASYRTGFYFDDDETISGSGALKPRYDQGEEQHYMDIDFGGFLDGSSNNSILGGFVDILAMLVNSVLLPVSILVAAWRWIYIAIFPLLAGTDPLDMMSKYDGNGKRKGHKGDDQGTTVNRGAPHAKYGGADPHKALLEEVKYFVFYLVIIFAVWLFLQLIMWGVVAVVNAFQF